MAEEKTSGLWYSERVDRWLLTNYRKNLPSVCKALGYSDENIDIISVKKNKKDLTELYYRHKELFDAFNSNESAKHRLGNRKTWTEYFHSLIAGWVMEDLFSLWLKKNGFTINRNGADSNRKILVDGVYTDPDITISKGSDFSRKVELIFEMTDILVKGGYIEKRYKSFIDTHREHGVYLHFDMPLNRYILIDLAAEDSKIHARYHEVWGKDVARYYLAENGKQAREFSCLAKELAAVCLFNPKEGKSRIFETEDEDSPMRFYKSDVEKKNTPQEESKSTEKESAPKNLEPKKAENVEKHKPQAEKKTASKPVAKPPTSQKKKEVKPPTPPPQPVAPTVEEDEDDYGFAPANADSVAADDFDCDFV